MRSATLLFALLLSLAACGDDAQLDGDGAPLPDSGGDVFDGGPSADANTDPMPQFGDPAGTIRIMEEVWPTGTPMGTAWASIRTAPDPFHTQTMASGACRLLEFEIVQCTPACPFDQYCDSNNTCQPFPGWQSAGDIELGGLKANVTLRDMGGYYYPEGPLPADLYDDGDTITASASGDAFPAFDLSATGVAPIDVELSGEMSDELRLTDGGDVTVSWGTADPGTRVRLWLPTPNNSHGAPSNFVIECEGPDTGSLVIPRAIVEAFPDNPRAEICAGHDCPLSWFMRYTADTQSTANGDIRLVVADSHNFFLVKE